MEVVSATFVRRACSSSIKRSFTQGLGCNIFGCVKCCSSDGDAF